MQGFLRGIVGYCIVNRTESKKLTSNSCAHITSLKCGNQKVWFLYEEGRTVACVRFGRPGQKQIPPPPKKTKKKSGKCQVPGVEQDTLEVLLHTVDSSLEDIREWRQEP